VVVKFIVDDNGKNTTMESVKYREALTELMALCHHSFYNSLWNTDVNYWLET
jgi:hypothetical protein